MSLAADAPDPGRIARAEAQAVAHRVHGPPPAPATRYEGLVTRAIAFSVDAALINVIALLVGVAIGLTLSVLKVPDKLHTVLVAIAGTAYLIWCVAYFVTFWSTTGQTPGNRLLRIRVTRTDGQRLKPRRSLLRLIALTLCAIPLLAGFLPILVDDRRRGVHDMIADTVVTTADDQDLSSPAAAPE